MGKLKDILGFVGDHPFLTGFLALAVFGSGVDCVRYSSPYRPEIRHEQAIGKPLKDTFIEYGGQRYFSQIDGIAAEENYQTRE